MKKATILFAVSTLIISCNQTARERANTDTPTEQSVEPEKAPEPVKGMDVESIPFSTNDVGSFPFFTLPKGLKEMNKPLDKNFDVCFFPINGVMTAFEGKLYKANITAEQGEKFSQHYFEKSMSEYLTSIGAVQIFDGEITQREYERYAKADPNKGDDGDIGYPGESIKFYAIRTKDKGNIYVQYSSTNAGAKLNVLQEDVFQQTITKITADDILKDLADEGKSILYINFDTDKSTLSPDGKLAVEEIAVALKKDTGLKVAIEGHTDNTGDASHNKKLSDDRANAVLNNLLSLGIEKSRLSAKGFGAERPLADNDSAESKAKNRRVELIKTN
ncbi:OmpA family protein [Sphingobacterium sp. LRF_L2]|uniref:OmpA family protein n=1 Tax=Sphingobacterium sp. LRF_L2 TaxID=3369421 RepID=UPI003F60035E